jgi:hypothetical protein
MSPSPERDRTFVVTRPGGGGEQIPHEPNASLVLVAPRDAVDQVVLVE